MTEISTCLWFDTDAEDAARFYVSLFDRAELGAIQRLQIDTPAMKAGEAVTVEISLNGTSYTFLNGGKTFPLSPAVSIMAVCDDQAEVERLWEALLDGGTPMQCGWLTDRFGVIWQIIPKRLYALMSDPDPDRARRATEAMMNQVKLDIAAIEAAADAP